LARKQVIASFFLAAETLFLTACLHCLVVAFKLKKMFKKIFLTTSRFIDLKRVVNEAKSNPKFLFLQPNTFSKCITLNLRNESFVNLGNECKDVCRKQAMTTRFLWMETTE
jgi:hypothetical protein